MSASEASILGLTLSRDDAQDEQTIGEVMLAQAVIAEQAAQIRGLTRTLAMVSAENVRLKAELERLTAAVPQSESPTTSDPASGL